MKFLPGILLLAFSILHLAIPVLAQNLGSSLAVTTEGRNLQDGDIVCSFPEGNGPCKEENTENIIGVVSQTSAVILQNDTIDGQPIASTGKVSVRVRGIVKAGDFITTSTNPGVGQKATKSGTVLGVAIQDNPSEGEAKILVSLGVRPVVLLSNLQNNLWEALRAGLSSAYLTPLAALRYVLAMLISLLSFVLAFIFFGRISRASVESIGRNPLASTSIQVNTAINLALTALIMLAGLGIAYFILIL